MADPAVVAKERPPIPDELKVLLAAAFVIAIGFGLVSPVLPAYARSFDVGVAAASFVVSIFAFFRLVFAPAGGALVQRLGERSGARSTDSACACRSSCTPSRWSSRPRSWRSG